MRTTSKILLIAILLAGLVLPVLATTVEFRPTGLNDDTIARWATNESFTVITTGEGNEYYSGSPNATTGLVLLQATDSSGGYTDAAKVAMSVDTSSLPDGEDITSATLRIYIEDASNALGDIGLALTGYTPVANGAVHYDDFNKMGSAPYAANITWGTYEGAGNYSFTLNAAGLAAINKTGYTNLMITTVWDLSNTAPTWSSEAISYYEISMSETSGTGQDMTLTVNYGAATVIDAFAYGDSTTLGNDNDNNWITLMKTRHNASMVVDRYGGPGWYSSVGLEHVDDYTNSSMHYYFPMFGVADSYYGITGTETGQNIDGICDAAEAKGATCIPLIHTVSSEYPDPGGTANITLEQNYLASQGRTNYVKVYDAIDMNPGNGVPDAVNESLVSDGTHPTNEAYVLMADYIWAHSGLSGETEPAASFSKNGTYGNTGTGRTFGIQFTDTSTNSPTGWNWTFINQTPGNNTEVSFSTSQNPAYGFGTGNWSIRLNSSNEYGYNISGSQLVKGLEIEGVVMSPSDHIYKTNISSLPIDANSTTYITSMVPTRGLWLNPVMPINLVDNQQDTQSLTSIGLPAAGDDIPIPIPDNLFLHDMGGDIIWDIYNVDTGTFYESYYPEQAENGTWSALTSVHSNITTYELRAFGESSAGNSGMYYIPLYPTYDEIMAGEINHAIPAQFYTSGFHTWPSTVNGNEVSGHPPMGQRFRLNASVDISGYGAKEQVILTALKTYGLFLVDNSGDENYITISSEYIDSDNDPNFSGFDWGFTGITVADFEAVDESALMVSEDSGQASTDALAPTAHFNMYILSYTPSITPTPTPSPTITPVPTSTPGEGMPDYGAPDILNGYYVGGAKQTTVGSTTFGGGTPEHVYTNATSTYNVDTRTELLNALDAASSGNVVYIEEWADIDMLTSSSVTIPGGVILASNRGQGGSAGGRIRTTALGAYSLPTMVLFKTGGNNVHITGLRLDGDNLPENYGSSDYCDAHYGCGDCCPIAEGQYRFGLWVDGHSGVEIDNCELSGFSYADIYADGCQSPGPWIHHNYVHGSLNGDEGYGINVGDYSGRGYGDALIEGNVFDKNRHSVTGDGAINERYTLRYNLFIGSLTYITGQANVDVHGRTNPAYHNWETYSGVRYDVYHNTLLGGNALFIRQRGYPSTGTYISYNDLAGDYSYTGYTAICMQDGYPTTGHVTASNNLYAGTYYPGNTGILQIRSN